MATQNSAYVNRLMQFSLKDPKGVKLSLIRVRMTINRTRLNQPLSADYKILPKHWDYKNCCAIEDPKLNPDLKGNAHLQMRMRNINKEVEKTRDAVIRVHESFSIRNMRPTAEQFRAALKKELNRDTAPVKLEFRDFLSFIDYYIDLCRKGTITNTKGKKLLDGSIRNYISTRSAIERYSKARRVKLRFEDITMEFYHDFVNYLNEATHSRGRYKPNVIGKYQKNIKVFMRYAFESGLTLNADFKKRDFKVFQENVDTVYLTKDELQKLYELELSGSHAETRDSFIISCYTSLRYSDIARLGRQHIREDGMIDIVTQKTGQRVIVPINSIVREILQRYGDRMPAVQSNQCTNRVIKKLCRMAGITTTVARQVTSGGVTEDKIDEKCELITSHTARRTAATQMFLSGLPTESIMKITGHKSIASYLRYIRVTPEENALRARDNEFFK